MDITCSKCGTEYSLDDTLISKSGTTVRCMNCNQIFKVFRKQDEEPDQWILRQAHGPIRTFDRLPMIQKWISEGKVSENDLISRKNGPWKKIGDIAELKALFKNNPASAGVQKKEISAHQSTIKRDYPNVENREPTMRHGLLNQTRKVGPKSESEKPTLPPPRIPKKSSDYTSDAPTPLATNKDPTAPYYSDLKGAEFSTGTTIPKVDPDYDPDKTVRRVNPFLNETTPPGAASVNIVKGPALSGTAKGMGPDFSQVPADRESEKWNRGAAIGVSEPAWTEKSVGVPLYADAGESLPPPKKTFGRWMIVSAIGVVLAAGTGVFLFVPDIGTSLLSSVDSMVTEPKENRFKKFFDRGQESFLMDSDAAFLQADREFQKVLALDENNSDALAALAQLYAVWAQYLNDAKLDAMADGGPSPDEVSTKEVERLSREFKEKLDEASGWADRALKADAQNRSAFLALADIMRLRGNLDQAASYLKKAKDIQFDTETEYVAVMLDIEKGDPRESLITRLGDLVANKPLLRGLYRQARLLAATGDNDKALATLDRLLSLNANHKRARELRERITANKPVWIQENGGDFQMAAQTDEPATPEPAGNKPKNESQEINAASVEKSAERSAEKSGESRDGEHSVGSMVAKAKRLQKRGKLQEAKSLYDKVLESSPGNLDALAGIGYYHLDKGASGQAIASFRRCLNVSSNYGPALIGLAETYKAMGQKNQALNFYQQYLSANPGGNQASLARRNTALLTSSETAPSPAPTETPSETADSPEASETGQTPVEEKPPTEAEPTPSEKKEKPEVIIIDRESSDTAASE